MKEYIHYNRFGGIKGLESAINSFEKEHPIQSLPNSGYKLRGWKVAQGYPKEIHNESGDLVKIIFRFENKSTGSYVARPWKVSVGKTAEGAEIFEKYNPDLNVPAYKVIPKTQINVGCLPIMRLITREITPRNNGAGGLNMKDVDVVPIDSSPLARQSNTKWAINKIKEHYSPKKGITSLYRGDRRIYSKNGVKPVVIYDADKMRELFFKNAREAVKDYVKWAMTNRGVNIKIGNK